LYLRLLSARRHSNKQPEEIGCLLEAALGAVKETSKKKPLLVS
jgi:hypothetical protein